MTTPTEILLSHFRSREHAIETGVEIGCFRGQTSAAILAAFPRLTLAMIDPWREYPAHHPYPKSGDPFAFFTREEAALNQAAADEATKQFKRRRHMLKLTSEVAAVRLGSWSRISFAFIDGSRREEDVAADLRLWWPRIEPGGIILGGGLSCDQRDGVTEAVSKWLNEAFPGVEPVNQPYESLDDFWWVAKGF